MKHLTTIAEYCEEINLLAPKHPEFDCRRFEEDMPSVKQKLDPIRHEFYAIGILFEGTSKVWHGITDMKANIIFNSPYQLISWDIVNDWKGIYLMFSQDFLMQCHFAQSLLEDFSFLQLDQIKPISVPTENIEFLKRKFEQVYEEYHSNHGDKFKFIESYVNLILLSIKRFSDDSQSNFFASEQNRNADLRLVSRYQALIESSLSKENPSSEIFSTSFYADRLAIHPNHLNAIIKRIVGKTAKQIIQEKVVLVAKSFLKQSDLSIKEIAYRLGYEESTHFSAFFKKETGQSPVQFREFS
jgi:AraC family transcriptional regulator, transcriptional activator of pobA